MILVEALTKENFWDQAKTDFPKAMANFCQFIDTYKIKSSYFDVVLNGNIKYHDLPGEMQFGIFCCYVNNFVQSGLLSKLVITFNKEDGSIVTWRNSVIKTFTFLEQHL